MTEQCTYHCRGLVRFVHIVPLTGPSLHALCTLDFLYIAGMKPWLWLQSPDKGYRSAMPRAFFPLASEDLFL